MLTVSIRNGMGTATISGSSVVLTGAKESDFMYFSSDFLFAGGVQSVQDGDFLVTQNSPAGMSVLVSAGTCYVPQTAYTKNGSLTKTWRVENDATTSALTIAANGSGSARVDIVCVKVDTAVTPDGEATNVATAVVVTGTPGAGVPATPSNYLKLAEVAVANGASSITTANITDKRLQCWLAPVHGPNGFMQNGQITRTVSSNNLTIAVKTLSGDDPSAINPVFVMINGVLRKITAALSVTTNAGTNWADIGSVETAGQDIDIFVYLGFKASDSSIFIGWSKFMHGITYADFSGTTTNQAYLAVSATPASTDVVELVDRVNVTLSGTASFNWSVPATSKIFGAPVFTTRYFTYAPVASGWSGTPTTTGRARLYGGPGSVTLEALYRATGTSNSTTTTVTLPVAPSPVTTIYQLARLADNSVTLSAPGMIQVVSSKTTNVFKLYDGTAMAATGTKTIEMPGVLVQVI